MFVLEAQNVGVSKSKSHMIVPKKLYSAMVSSSSNQDNRRASKGSNVWQSPKKASAETEKTGTDSNGCCVDESSCSAVDKRVESPKSSVRVSDEIDASRFDEKHHHLTETSENASSQLRVRPSSAPLLSVPLESTVSTSQPKDQAMFFPAAQSSPSDSSLESVSRLFVVTNYLVPL